MLRRSECADRCRRRGTGPCRLQDLL